MAQLNPMLEELQTKIEQHRREAEIVIDKVAQKQNYITLACVAFNIVVFLILQYFLGGREQIVERIPNEVLSMLATILLLLVSFPFASEFAKKNLRDLKLDDESIKPSMRYAGEWEYDTDFRIQSPDDDTPEYERFHNNMINYKEHGISVWSQNVFELKIDFGNSTIKGDFPQIIWHSNPINYDEHEVSWSFGGKIWWKDDKNFANEFSGIEQYTVKSHDSQGRPCKLEGHLVGTILVGEHFYVVDAVSSFTRKS